MCSKVSSRWNKGLWGDSNWGEAIPERLKGRWIPVEGGKRFWNGVVPPFFSPDFGILTRESMTEAFIRLVRKRYADLQKDWIWKRRLRYRILDKAIAYILMIDAIDAVFPDAYHVFCIRDPRSVLNSFLRFYRFPDVPHQSHMGRLRMEELGFWALIPPGYKEHQDEPLLKRLSWQIRRVYEIGFDSRSSLEGRLIEFRYEWLLGDAHGSILSLFERLELSPWLQITELIPSAFPDYAPPWPNPGKIIQEPYGKRRCYTDDEIDQLSDAEKFAVELGYEPHCAGILAPPVCHAPVSGRMTAG
jgi:hypothetical protein